MGTSQQSVVPIGAMILTIEDLRDDAIAGLVDQGYSRTEATAAVGRSSSTDFSGLFRDGLEWLSSRRATGQERGISIPIKEKPKMKTAKPEARICRGYERDCKNELTPRNTTGLCSACYARKGYHDRKPKGSKKSAVRRVVNATPPAVDRQIVSIHVDEAQLNRFLVGLSLLDKQTLVQTWLSGEQTEQ